MSGLRYSISVTTRPPRPGERDGVDYYFVSEEEFQRLRESGGLLEWACVYGNYYGTPRQPVEEALGRGEDVLLEIDVQGARQVKEKCPEAVAIFIMPPSYQELARRLAGRGTEDTCQRSRRLALAKAEVSQARYYDYVVVNEDVAAAADKIRAIIVAEKCRPFRAAPSLLMEEGEDEQTDH
jgi:guanylate kinase